MIFPSTVNEAFDALKNARYCESIFGNKDEVTDNFRLWAKIVHEDKVSTKYKDIAHQAFILLKKLYDQAEEKIKNGTYGDKKPLVIATLRTKTVSYNLFSLIQSGDIADLYEAKNNNDVSVLVKICRNPANNDLMKNEADILAKLPAEIDPKHNGYFPNLLDSFELGIGKIKNRVNVFNCLKDGVSLFQVNESYKNTLDPRDAAWMWNRMLESLHLLHINGYVHGALTPDRFIIIPETHQGMLIDFCYSVKNNGTVKAISKKWENFYPAEILNKKGVDESTDIYMAAKCLKYILKDNMPPTVNNLLKACMLGKAHRIKSSKVLYEDFKITLRRLYGKRTFRKFNFPAIKT